MRIAWITPFNTRSAIGRVTSAIAENLIERGHHVVIVRSELTESPPLTHALPMCWWRDTPVADLNAQYDAIVANLGDNYPFHAGVLPYLDSAPCLGVFHDYYLFNFFNGWLAHNGLSADAFDRAVQAAYGQAALETAGKARRGQLTLDDIARELPMTEWVGMRCAAALAHSGFYIDRLKASCPGPVAVAPLPFQGRDIPPLTARAGGEVVLATIGVLNENKRADLVIQALGASPLLRERVQYRLVGAATDSERERLTYVAQQCGVTRLEFLGEVDDETLCAELARADIISCLRKPVLEGASASAIEGMKAGRPIIVANAGFYSDLPDDLVFKVPADIDLASLTSVLERLVSDEALRRRTGERAKDWAERRFTVSAYSDVLEDLLEEFINAKPLAGVSQRMGLELSRLGVAEDSPAVQRIAATLQDLFAADPQQVLSRTDGSQDIRDAT